jgi:hypothetical protein
MEMKRYGIYFVVVVVLIVLELMVHCCDVNEQR